MCTPVGETPLTFLENYRPNRRPEWLPLLLQDPVVSLPRSMPVPYFHFLLHQLHVCVARGCLQRGEVSAFASALFPRIAFPKTRVHAECGDPQEVTTHNPWTFPFFHYTEGHLSTIVLSFFKVACKQQKILKKWPSPTSPSSVKTMSCGQHARSWCCGVVLILTDPKQGPFLPRTCGLLVLKAVNWFYERFISTHVSWVQKSRSFSFHVVLSNFHRLGSNPQWNSALSECQKLLFPLFVCCSWSSGKQGKGNLLGSRKLDGVLQSTKMLVWVWTKSPHFNVTGQVLSSLWRWLA